MAGLMTPAVAGLPRVSGRKWGCRLSGNILTPLYSPHDGTLDSLVLPVVTAEAMSIFLKEVAQRHPEEFILMFLDGAGWHRANDLAVPKNMRLEALPPYSPQLNPVEHIWDEIREKWFANEVFNSLDAVEDRLVEALVALENDKELVSSTTGFDWIINCR